MTDTVAASASITAGITYAVDTGEKPVNETFGPGNIRRRNSGAKEVRPMQIRDVRLLAAQGGLAARAAEQLAILVHLRYDAEPEIRAATGVDLGEIAKRIGGGSAPPPAKPAK